MGYRFNTLDFGQFDRDNMNRWLTAEYINEANSILPKILASPRADSATAVLQSADADAASALAAYAAMDYPGAVALAQSAYLKVLAGATQANVKIEPEAWPADYKSKGVSSRSVDPIDYPALAA